MHAIVPDSVTGTGVTGSTIAAASAALCTWETRRRWILVSNDTGADLLIVHGADGASASNYGERVRDGCSRKFLDPTDTLSVYALATAIFSGAGQNCSIVGMPE